MSHENVKPMRRTFERWNAGERKVDSDVTDPEIVVHSAMTNATYHGYAGLRRWFAEIDNQFEDWTSRSMSSGRRPTIGSLPLGRCTSAAVPVASRSINRWPWFLHLRRTG